MNAKTIIPVFVPHQGCPFDCVFCNQHRITGADSVDIKQTVLSFLDNIKPEKYQNTQIAFFGGSFTGIERSLMENMLQEADRYVKTYGLSGIRISTRPDYIDSDILKILQKYNVQTIELGVQSMDEYVLHASHRGHDAESVIKAIELIRAEGFELGLQTMIGLPGDNLEKALETARKIISLKPDLVRIYPVLVLEDTALERLFLKGEYLPLTVEEAVDWCAQLVTLYEKAGINIARIGLQTSDSLIDSVVAGPWHPAFGQLVADYKIYDIICGKLKDKHYDGDLFVVANAKIHSNVIGHKKCNVTKLKERFGFNNVKVIGQNEREIDDKSSTICRISAEE